MKVLYSFLLCIFLCIITSCFGISEEIERVPSPSEKVDAVIITENYGATTSLGYLVYLVDKNEKVNKNDKGFRFYAEKAHGLYVKWFDDENITIYYPQKTRIDGYRNHSTHYEEDGSYYTIHISIEEFE